MNPKLFEQFVKNSETATGGHTFQIPAVPGLLFTEITLRDLFAGMAMQGFMSRGDSETTYNECVPDGREEIGRVAYRLADAMLAAREPKQFPGSDLLSGEVSR